MARQRGFGKFSLPPFLRDSFGVIARKGAIVILVLALSLAAVMLVRTFLSRSEYFKVHAVDIRAPALDIRSAGAVEGKLLELYRGRHIFDVSLRELTARVQRAFPDAKDIVSRVTLPDQLTVTMRFRTPVAIVRGMRYYPVDEEGVVLARIDPRVIRTLPMIEGVSIWSSLQKGKGDISPNLRCALTLLAEAKRFRWMADYGIVSIDARTLRDLSFVLSNGIEVKIGFERYPQRLEVLDKTLKAKRLAIDRISYIDLRFGDVTVGPKA